MAAQTVEPWLEGRVRVAAVVPPESDSAPQHEWRHEQRSPQRELQSIHVGTDQIRIADRLSGGKFEVPRLQSSRRLHCRRVPTRSEIVMSEHGFFGRTGSSSLPLTRMLSADIRNPEGEQERRPGGPPFWSCADGRSPYASGTATKRVACALLTCSSTLRLPDDFACASSERTSPILATALPPTLRMTSPVWMPRCAAGPCGSTSVTTTPFWPAPCTSPAGARLRPRRGGMPASGCDLPSSALACRSFGNSPSASVTVLLSPLWTTSSFTDVPGARVAMVRARSRESLIAVPLTAVMTSPASMPAFAAGLPSCGLSTIAPRASLRARLSAISDVTGCTCTPSQPRVTAPLSFNCATTSFAVEAGM